MRSLILILLMTLSPVSAVTASSDATTYASCEAVPWPFSRAQTKADYVHLFKKIRRPVLIEYYMDEVTHPKGAGLPFYLGTFLAETESDGMMKGFFETVQEGAILKDEKSIPQKLEPKEVCKYYKFALDQRGQADAGIED